MEEVFVQPILGHSKDKLSAFMPLDNGLVSFVNLSGSTIQWVAGYNALTATFIHSLISETINLTVRN